MNMFVIRLSIILLTLALVACGGRDAPRSQKDAPTNPPAPPSPATPSPTNAPRSTSTAASPTATIPRTSTATSVGSAPVTSTEKMLRYVISQAKHPLAVCNDGTTPVFYYRRGTGEGARKWVVWFKGGSQCFTPDSCKDRERGLMSSNPWSRSELGRGSNEDDAADGILNNDRTKNPDFYNWNHVYLVYCTSDHWMGTRGASAETQGLYFRGHYVTNAMIDALQDENIIGTPTMKNATHILLTGSSAGGAGLRNNVDRLAKQLNWADVRSVSDAAASVLDNTPFAERRDQAQSVMWQVWQPQPDESCALANPSRPWDCIEGSYLIRNNHIQTPMFVYNDLLDSRTLHDLELNLRDSKDHPAIETIAVQTHAMLKNRDGAFGPAANYHVILNTDRFYTLQVNNLTMAQVLGNWYFNRPGPKNVLADPKR